MELGTLLEKMLDECDVDNYEEWVEKLDIRPELRQQLDHIVSEERFLSKLEDYLSMVKQIQKTANRNDIPTIGDILRLPEIFKNEEVNEKVDR